MAFNKQKYMNNSFFRLSYFRFSDDKLATYIIPLEFNNRPDLISYSLYGDYSYQPVLSYINNIYETPEGYYAGRVIKVLKREFIESL